MASTTPLLFVGLGPIGRAALACSLARTNLRIVAACDASPELAGRKLNTLISGAPARVRIAPSIAALPRLPRGTVAIVCTSSHIPQAAKTFEALLARGVHVVSSCEELVYPQWRHAAWAKRADRLAKKKKVALLGTGVNPGFVLDLLPAALTGPCLEVRAIRAHRVVDAATRRGPLQRKVGAGKSVAEFRAEVAAGRLGHIGLPESAALLCHALGYGRPTIAESIDPVFASKAITTPFVELKAGDVAGIDHRLTAKAKRGGATLAIALHLEMYLGAPDPADSIEIDGEPSMKARLSGGTPGDVATVAALLNAAAGISLSAPGLRTVLDGPFPLCRAIG